MAVESVEEKEERNCSTGNSLDSNREKEEEIGATSTLCFRFSHRRSKGEGKRKGGEPRFIAAPSIVVPEGRGVYPRKGVYGGIVIEVVCDDSMRPEFCRPDAKEKGGSINVSDFYCLHLFLLSEVCYFSFWDSFDGSARIAEEEEQPEKQ